MNRIIFSILTLLIWGSLFSQSSTIWLEPNKGQWNESVLHRVKVPKGHLYIDQKGFSYSLSNYADILHHHGGENELEDDSTVTAHFIKAEFLNAVFKDFEESGKSAHYNNYYLGNKKENWASKVHSFSNIEYTEIYPGINLEIFGLASSIKYNLNLQPGANLDQVQIKYKGAELQLSEEGLLISTLFGTILEKSPVAYYADNKEEIKIRFILKGNTLSFKFSQDIDPSRAIVVDPEIVFSSFTGSTTDNWGNTACPGANGDLYAAGISFGSGYPITAGVFQSTWGGGTANSQIAGNDVAITKFSSDGTSLLYSTYLGGSRNEIPHSMISNSADELFLFGSTSSLDFPTSLSAYQTILNGVLTSTIISAISFQGSDIFVSHLAADGTALLGSTFYGGSDFDGIAHNNTLTINYGDQFRGEIMIDDNDNVFVTGTTRSNDLPLVNPIKNTLGGLADAFVVKFDPSLSNLLFATYLGSDGFDAGRSLQLDSSGDIFVGGGTHQGATFMQAQVSTYKNSPFGQRDGYVVKINGGTFQLEATRFIGTTTYDQTYFVQIDLNDDVYAYGQTAGNFPVFNTGYTSPNSSQFITKFDNNLDNNLWSTTFGAGDGRINISPTAFLVSDCGQIYVSGWGGVVNHNPSIPLTANSTTDNMDITPDAFQPTTNGSNFYLAVFEPDMASLNYATYMGGGSSSFNHVDGGTSRFDKNGNIYHAVCAACSGSANGFTSTPGVFSETNNSPNCNMAAFKFKLATVDATISIPDGLICLPNSVIFENESQNGNQFIWYFGDGSSSTEFEPEYLYPGPGTYQVTLVAVDTNNCYQTDSAVIDIVISIYQGEVTQPLDTICPGESIQLNASNGILYHWEPANLVNDPSSNSPIATVDSTTIFTVIVGDSCGSDTLTIIIPVYEYSGINANDAAVCEGDSVQLLSFGGVTYHWEPALYVINNNVSSPFVNPPSTMDFYVDITTPEGCLIKDTVNVEVLVAPPNNFLPEQATICRGDLAHFELDPSYTYSWSPNYNISSTTSNSVDVFPDVDTIYFLEITNICGVGYDTIRVNVIQIQADISSDTTICKGSSLSVSGFGGVSYHWYPESYFDDFTSQNPIVTPPFPSEIWVEVADNNGCTDSASMFINFFPTTFLTISPDLYLLEGDTAIIWANATNPGQLFWTPPEFLDCAICDTTVAFPPTNMTYTANFIDTNGCLIKDNVTIHFDPLLYVPNAFTPNGDGMNDFFGAKGGNFIKFELLIFNRWGELIFEGAQIEDWWDGRYKGEKVQDGVYVWKIRFEDFNNNIKVIFGHVTSLR